MVVFSTNLAYGQGYRIIPEEVPEKEAIVEKMAEEIPVLLYHHIASQEEIEKFNWENNGSVISLESFEKQIMYLKENDYYTASLKELELFMDKKIDLPEKTIVITFDDGYWSNIEYAYPLMKEIGFRGSIFMVGETATRDESNLSPGEFLHIPAEHIGKYEDVFEFGSHTFDLHSREEDGTPLLISKSKKQVMEDLRKNKELFPSRFFAYPYGSYISESIKAIEELGYTMSFTVRPGLVTRETHKFEIPRLIPPKTSIEAFAEKIKNS